MLRKSLIDHHIAKWSVVFVAATGLVKAAQFGLFSYLAVVLTVESYGRFGLYYAFLSAMGTFAATGIGERTAGQLKDHATSSERRQLFRRNAGVFVLVALAAFIVIAPVGLYATAGASPSSASPLLVALALGLVLAYATVQGMFLRLDQALGASLLANVGVLALSIAGMGLAATVTRDLESLFWSGFLGACVGVACLAARRRLYFGFVGFSGMHETRALLPFAVIGLFGWISGYGMNAVIGRTLEIEAVAKYTFLFTISSLAHLVASSMNAVWAPRFYDLFNSGRHDELNRKNTIFFAVQAYVVGATGVLAVLGMTVLSGHSERLRFYAEDGLELGLLFISYVIYVAFYQVVSYYHVTGNASRLMRVQIISGTAGLALWIALIFILGVFGVFLGCAVFALVRSYMLYVDARRDWRISPTWMPILLSATAVVMVAIW